LNGGWFEWFDVDEMVELMHGFWFYGEERPSRGWKGRNWWKWRGHPRELAGYPREVAGHATCKVKRR
jgi:hypothetical protein